MSEPLHGVMAEFAQPEQLLSAARAATAAGYRRLDAYSPLPVSGLAEALGNDKGRRIASLVLLAVIFGASTGYALQYYSIVINFPLNLGGRPTHSWPFFIPVTIELGILFGALTAFVSMLVMSGLPRLRHPLFDVPGFDAVTRDRFFLCLEAGDGDFDTARARAFLAGLKPLRVIDVPP